MISMIYMPGLHTCLLLDRRIAGSPDRRIAGSHRFAACAAFAAFAPLCSLCAAPQLLYLFGILKLYPNTPQSQAFFDNFLKIPCRTTNSSISSTSGSLPEIRFSQFILPSPAKLTETRLSTSLLASLTKYTLLNFSQLHDLSSSKLTEISRPNPPQPHSAVSSRSLVSHFQSVYQPVHNLTD